MGSYSLFMCWIVSVYHELIHGQLWISTCFAHTWTRTRLPGVSSLFQPPWLLLPSSARWRVPRVSRAQSRASPWVLQPRTFLAFLCQPTLCDYCSQDVDSDWVTALHGGLSFTTKPEIPLHEKGRWVFWEVTLMLHLWHHKKRLHIPFW